MGFKVSYFADHFFLQICAATEKNARLVPLRCNGQHHQSGSGFLYKTVDGNRRVTMVELMCYYPVKGCPLFYSVNVKASQKVTLWKPLPVTGHNTYDIVANVL